MTTIDGLRTELYNPEKLAQAKNTFPAIMTEYLINRGTEHGFEVVPLEQYFIKKHNKTGERFEFLFNGHWNENGHNIMAEAILSSKTFTELFR